MHSSEFGRCNKADGLFKKQRRLINPTSIFPPPTSLCKFSKIEMFWEFKI